MSAITAKASRKMKKYAVLTREPRCFLGSFDFSWEQRKAKEICSIGTGKSNTQDQVDDGKYPFYIRSDVPVRSNKYLYDCEAVITIGDGNIGKVFHYVNGKFDLHQRCYKMTDFKDIWGKYFFYYFSTKFYDRAMKMTAKATVDSVRLEMISEMDIKKPPQISEQKQIAEFFANLDNLITLHQRKCANLCSPSQVVFSLLFATSTFSWEQRKLGDIGKARSGVGFPDADQGGVTGVPFFKVSDMNLDGNENEMIVANNYVTAEQIADHRWSPITELPAIFFAKVGAAVMLNRKRLCRFPFLLDNNTMAYSLSPTKWDADFAKALFGTVDLTSLVQVGALPSYNARDVESMGIYLPSLFEQEQIGAFFKLLDNLITLHQRECISFTGRADRLILTANKKRTTSSWEQRKLGDIADIVGGGTPSTGNQSYWDGDIDWYAPAEIADQIYANSSQKKITGLGYENSSAKMLPPGTVLFTSRAGIGKTAILTRKGCTNQGFQSIVPHRGELDSYFIFSRTEELKRYGELVGAGSTFVEVSGKQMAVMELMMPPTMREQQTIGGFFQQLDHLITLHQRKPFLMKWRTSDANRNQTNRLVL